MTSQPAPEANDGGGLRERSKARRRAAIEEAAMQLFAANGYDATTVADIAAVAEVAPRTVSMYFPTKADLALSWSDELGARFVGTCHRMEGASYTEVIDAWLRGEIEEQDGDRAERACRMFLANPALRAMSTARLSKEFELGGPLLAREVDLPQSDPIFAILGAAIGAALDEYFALVARGRRGAALHEPMMVFLRQLLEAARQASARSRSV